jgi:hypothetical protein
MGMEDEARDFLIRIVHTLSMVLLWMLANLLFGIYLGYGFFEGSPSWTHITYYILSLSSFVLLLRHLRKRWKL